MRGVKVNGTTTDGAHPDWGKGGMPGALGRRFKLIAFDWDGTAVADRREDPTAVRGLLERLLRTGVPVVVITGTNFTNVDRQLSSAITGPHKARLYVATNRGSEVYGFDAESRPALLWQRTATPDEDRLLTEVADAVRDTLAARDRLDVQVIYNRLNRRKIDLLPTPEWADPDKSALGELLAAVEARLREAGLTRGLGDVLEFTEQTARAKGLRHARITSDIKHVEVGLTDKADAVDWIMRELARPNDIRPEEVLIIGDEFGPVASAQGSDEKMVIPGAAGAVFVSVGPEPGGVPPGVIHLPGGPARFRDIIAAQLAMREPEVAEEPAPPASEPDLPAAPTSDPAWLLVNEGFDIAWEPGAESLFAISNGYVGTRGSMEELTRLSSPATYIAGVFDQKPGAVPELAVAPDWTRLRIGIEGQELRIEDGEVLEHRRVLDARQGILWREWRHRDPSGRVTRLRSMRFASREDPHVVCQSVTLTPENYSGRLVLEARLAWPGAGSPASRSEQPRLLPAAGTPSATATPLTSGSALFLLLRAEAQETTVGMGMASTLSGASGKLGGRTVESGDGWVAERWEWDAEIGRRYRMDRPVAIYTSRDSRGPARDAAARADRLAEEGMEKVVAAHIEAWADRWAASDVEVVGDEAAQRALRFAVYHMLSAVNPADERVSIGARALTGDSYKGHVFWDTETYMLPFYSFTQPPAARSLLMYRYHTLPAAREKARRMGYLGALYAWESTDTGEETTPPFVFSHAGEKLRVLTGEQEHHISADVAYAVWQYWQATGDESFLKEAGAEIIIETARFWASVARLEADGLYHIRRVIGPDEYHESVDDNAYTNGMARWNLETAAAAVHLLETRWPERWRDLSRHLKVDAAEPGTWLKTAAGLKTGFDERTGLIEQFEGFFSLEKPDMSLYPEHKVPLDVLLGRERTQRTQVVKQADVVLLIGLLWDRFEPWVREVNFRYYEPITGHGSSLSPAMHALVAARLGDVRLAKRYFRQAADIDMANNMGNCAGGVHAAALGGLWQAAVFGFAGLSMRDGELSLDPHLPETWRQVRFSVTLRGRQVRFHISQEGQLSIEAAMSGDRPLTIGVTGGPRAELSSGIRLRAGRARKGWEWREAPGT